MKYGIYGLLLLTFAIFYSCKKIHLNSEGPDWDKVKSEVTPTVMFPNDYGTPYHLELNTLGWEDGQYITRDGLTMYCFYMPIDLLAFAFIGKTSDICAMGPYIRGPFAYILNTPPPVLENSCNQFLNTVILISHRNSVNEPFPAWKVSNVSTPATINGAPQVILNDSIPGLVDFFVFVHLNPDQEELGNLAIYKNTSLNPMGSFTKLPSPVNNPNYSEDNPHIERIAPNELVLFFRSDDRPDGVGAEDIFYTQSHDNGNSWEPVQSVNFNTEGFEDMPHIWQDSTGIWWMYYMNAESNIVKRKQTIPNVWKNWDEEILVMDRGNALAVG